MNDLDHTPQDSSATKQNLTATLFDSMNVLELIRQRLLLATERELGTEEVLGMATMLGSIKREISSSAEI